MSAILVTGPVEEPITLAEAKTHLRVTHSDDDAYITELIVAARLMAEHETGRKLIEQTWDVYFDAFPVAEIAIPPELSPLRAVLAITYLDIAQVEQTVSITDYSADTYPARGWIIPDTGFSWPATWPGANAVRIRVQVGIAADAAGVPAPLKAWAKLQLGQWYEQRSAAAERQMYTTPFTDRLLDPWRLTVF